MRRVLMSLGVLCAGPVLALQTQSAANAAQALRYRTLPVDMDVRPAAAIPVRGDDGRSYLLYNVLVTNWSTRALTLESFQVVDPSTEKVLVTYDREALQQPFRQRAVLSAAGSPSDANLVLESGRSSIVSVGIVLASGARFPASVVHQAVFAADAVVRIILDNGVETADLIALSDPASVQPESEVAVLGPPLRGGPWYCGNGLSSSNAHATALISGTPRLRVPQRYACDFAKMDEGGNRLPSPFGNVISNDMFYGHGADVLAVRDAEVVFVRDGIPENVPLVTGEVRMSTPLTNASISGTLVT